MYEPSSVDREALDIANDRDESPPPPTSLPLVGITEVARRAGVLKPAVSNWRRRYSDFPSPVAELHTGPVWWWPSVETWLISTQRETNAGWTVEDVSPDAPRWALRKAAGIELRALPGEARRKRSKPN